jgi:hypothetical protein
MLTHHRYIPEPRFKEGTPTRGDNPRHVGPKPFAEFSSRCGRFIYIYNSYTHTILIWPQFMPVYEEIYTLLERTCLPDFLSTASANINLPKQIYWYCVGILNMSIGSILAISLIMMLPTPPEANRAWRLISVGFFSLGSAQCYSAWRG